MASKGCTTAYRRNGKIIAKFESRLPNGSGSTRRPNSEYSILDCIFNSERRTYWVLDILCWGGLPVIDSEAEFRAFWLTSKLTENPAYAVRDTSGREGRTVNARVALAHSHTHTHAHTGDFLTFV